VSEPLGFDTYHWWKWEWPALVSCRSFTWENTYLLFVTDGMTWKSRLSDIKSLKQIIGG